MPIQLGMISLGCAKNLVDSEHMLAMLQEDGIRIVDDVTDADVVVINTCGFIEAAKQEAIETILETAQLKQTGSLKALIVTGCLVQRYKDEFLSEMPEVDAVLGTGSYTSIVDAVHAVLEDRESAYESFEPISEAELESGRVLLTPQHYAYLKIAEGCSNRCAYCIIPALRGKYRSRSMDDVLYEARLLADSGVKELIVVAQDTSRYGTDLPEHKRLLPELLRRLCQIEKLHWIRIHYVYPDEIDDELMDVIASQPKIVKYLDIPIQHCNSEILKRMNRRGDRQFLDGLLKKLRQRIPGLVIRTSLIVGLPGEGEEEFQELCDFLAEHRLERAGAFVFSPEEGTPAAAMPHVDVETATRRAETVELLQGRIMDEYNAALVGKTLEVLVDGFDEET